VGDYKPVEDYFGVPDAMTNHQNPDGTYNLVTYLSSLTGLSEAEVQWTAERLKQLMKVEGKSKAEATAIVKEEGKSRPWEVE
jgi:uncharacterized protein YoaH (UPF0181 family)